MDDIYDAIEFGGQARNAAYLGTFVAWLVVNRLIDDQVERKAGSAAARVRMQDMTGSAFLTTVLHGELRASHLSESGRQFVDDYFVPGDYRDDFAAREYRGDDEWLLYDELAPRITAAFRRRQKPARRRMAKILKFPGR